MKWVSTKFRHIWSSLDKSRPNCTRLEKSRRIRISPEQFEKKNTNLNTINQVWTILDKCQQVQRYLNKFRQVWTSSDKFEQVQTSLKKFRQVWTTSDKFHQSLDILRTPLKLENKITQFSWRYFSFNFLWPSQNI